LNETRLGGIKIGGRIIIRELNATSATEAQRPQRGCDGNLVCDINPWLNRGDALRLCANISKVLRDHKDPDSYRARRSQGPTPQWGVSEVRDQWV
jgi:hypothetical protein